MTSHKATPTRQRIEAAGAGIPLPPLNWTPFVGPRGVEFKV
jgi:hypothetical protein